VRNAKARLQPSARIQLFAVPRPSVIGHQTVPTSALCATYEQATQNLIAGADNKSFSYLTLLVLIPGLGCDREGRLINRG